MKKISFVIPVHNEEGNIELLHEEISGNINKCGLDYEMIFIDDGSTDRSLDVIKKLREKSAKVRYISFSRNFGQQGAIFAGLTYSSGDAAIIMDADLQHPPSLIPQMIDLWKRGADVVYTVKSEANVPALKHVTARAFYWLISRVSNMDFNAGQSDFKLIDRKVLKVVLQMPEYHKFIRGQVVWAGFRQERLLYAAQKRKSGNTKFSYKRMFSLALDGIFAFSKYPLHLVTIMSLVIFCLSSLYILYNLFVWMLTVLNISHSFVFAPGWMSIAVAVYFLGSIQLIVLGILGEYVSRIYDQVKGRPVFVIKEESGK